MNSRGKNCDINYERKSCKNNSRQTISRCSIPVSKVTGLNCALQAGLNKRFSLTEFERRKSSQLSKRSNASRNQSSINTCHTHTPDLPPIRNSSALSNMSNEKLRVHSRCYSSVSRQGANMQDPEIIIKGWFSNANAEEKEMALKLLSAVSSLSTEKHFNVSTPLNENKSNEYKSRHSQCGQSRSSRCNHNRNTIDGRRSRLVESFYPTNVQAMAYNTNGRMVNEFVIHPEWCTRNQLLPSYPQDENKNETKIQYGYWKK